MFELVIDTRKISVRRREKITAGSVGIEAHFEFSADWEGLNKAAVFETDSQKIAVELLSDRVKVPWELCAEAGADVIVGVYGTDENGSIVIPTVYAKLDTVSVGASTEGASNAGEPSPSDIQQLMAAANSALHKAEELERRADTGEFKGEKGDTYTLTARDRDDIADAVRGGIAPELEGTKRNLDALWKLNRGISYEFETETGEGLSKTVPQGAKCVNVKKIGGRSAVRNQLYSFTGSRTDHGITAIHDPETDIIHFSGTSSARGGAFGTASRAVNGHKYLLHGHCSNPEKIIFSSQSFGSDSGSGAIIVSTREAERWYYVFTISAADLNMDGVTMKPQLVDLTLMFGPEAAEKIKTPEDAYAMGVPRSVDPVNDGTIVRAAVTSVSCSGKAVFTVPESVQALPGYGGAARNAYNELDFENGLFIRRAGELDMGTLDWGTVTLGETGYFCAQLPASCAVCTAAESADMLTRRYIATAAQHLNEGLKDRYMALDTQGVLYVRDSAYTNEAVFKAVVSGMKLFYELNEPEITDISELLAGAEPVFEVKAGDVIGFENDSGLPVFSETEYFTALNEVMT